MNLGLLKEKKPALPVILVTGTGSEEVAVEALKKGAEDYVIKSPKHIRRVQNAIKAVLGKRSTLDALRESQERYRELVETTEDFIIQVDMDGNFLFVNNASKKILGLNPDECIGRSAFSFIHQDDQEETQNRFFQFIKQGDSQGTFECRHVSQTGDVSHLNWVANFHYDEDGNIISVAIDKLVE